MREHYLTMPQLVGFSTGSLAPGSTRQAVEMLRGLGTTALELSALRINELDEVLSFINIADFTGFDYVSFHAPSRLNGISEADLILQLHPVIQKRWPVIVHPDVVTDWPAWRALGDLLVIENMDGRKPLGRTIEELEPIFTKLPEAGFCLDIGHAGQIDPSMALAVDLLDAFNTRLVEVHLSVVDDSFAHQPLTVASIASFGPVLRDLPNHVAIILETPVQADAMSKQLAMASTHLHVNG